MWDLHASGNPINHLVEPFPELPLLPDSNRSNSSHNNVMSVTAVTLPPVLNGSS